MNETTGTIVMDSGDSNRTGTAFGTTIVAGRFGMARSFTNQPSYIDLGQVIFGGPPGEWSFETWIRIDSWSSDQETIYYDGADGEVEIGLAPDSALFFSVHTSSGWSQLTKSGLALGRWYHVAATLNNWSLTQSLYVNGVLAGRAATSGWPVVLAGPYRPTIGSHNAGAYFYGFLGTIDEVRMSAMERSPGDFDIQLPPKNLVVIQSGGAAKLVWNNGGGAVGLLKYRIYRGLDSVNVSLIDSTTSGSYTDAGVADGYTYFYRIAAIDVTGFEGASSVARSFTFYAPPNQVSLIYPVKGVTLSSSVEPFLWHRAGGSIDRYWFELATDSLFMFRSIDTSIADTSTVVPNLSSGRFWWRVRAHSLAGWGQFSQIGTFNTVIASLEPAAQLPRQFRLLQNYPNPFNPFTTIGYEVPRRAHVELIVYNVLGQKMVTLVSQELDAGSYQIRFDGTNLASGTYFYRLRAGGVEITKRLFLLK